MNSISRKTAKKRDLPTMFERLHVAGKTEKSVDFSWQVGLPLVLFRRVCPCCYLIGTFSVFLAVFRLVE
jgi:hypothetical protein